MNITGVKFDISPNICSQCGLTWRGVHSCVDDLKKRIRELEAVLLKIKDWPCTGCIDTIGWIHAIAADALSTETKDDETKI